jgi:enamine deaminase RidA (YjgF/YER057c/UK114 family)
VSGTTARTLQLGGDAYTQARAALVIIADALAKTGAGMHHVVRTVVYVLDLADTEHVARAHSEAFDQIRPASTLVQVSALTPASARVEIEAMAIIHD